MRVTDQLTKTIRLRDSAVKIWCSKTVITELTKRTLQIGLDVTKTTGHKYEAPKLTPSLSSMLALRACLGPSMQDRVEAWNSLEQLVSDARAETVRRLPYETWHFTDPIVQERPKSYKFEPAAVSSDDGWTKTRAHNGTIDLLHVPEIQPRDLTSMELLK